MCASNSAADNGINTGKVFTILHHVRIIVPAVDLALFPIYYHACSASYLSRELSIYE